MLSSRRRPSLAALCRTPRGPTEATLHELMFFDFHRFLSIFGRFSEDFRGFPWISGEFEAICDRRHGGHSAALARGAPNARPTLERGDRRAADAHPRLMVPGAIGRPGVGVPEMRIDLKIVVERA